METHHKLLIPVIGHENAGKSTLIDALIGGEYTQTEAVRCTMIPYRFTLHTKLDAEKTKDVKFPSIREVNKAISENNSKKDDKSVLKFDILLRAPLVKEMENELRKEVAPAVGDAVQQLKERAGSAADGEVEELKQRAGDLIGKLRSIF